MPVRILAVMVLALLAVGAVPTLGSFSITRSGIALVWGEAADFRTARGLLDAALERRLASRQGFLWMPDGAERLHFADLGGSASTPSLGQWSFDFGAGSELTGITEERSASVDPLTLGIGGRLLSRHDAAGDVAFTYDAEGRRRSDDHFTYTYDWRGHLVQVDVLDPQPDASPSILKDAAGQQITYVWDALGRLASRTVWARPGGDGRRAFIAKRLFTYDGDTLVVETGLNYADQPIWWRQIIPGPSGLADAPQMRIEQAADVPHVFAVIHDEQGSVIGIASDDASVTGVPLRARFFYSPYGEAHVETGPELLHVKYDSGLTTVGGQTQHLPPPVPPATVSPNAPGGVRIATTIPLDPASFATGLLVERLDGASGQWVTVDPSTFAIANADQSSDDAELDLMPLAGFPKGERYRIMLKPSLHDGFGRSLQIPTGEPPTGVELALDIPQGDASPSLEREWKLTFDIVTAASNELDHTVPGGFNLLFGGAWTDPVTGLALRDGRWYDPRNATYLDEDPDAADTDSLYAFASGAPHMGAEPSFGAAIPDVSWAEGMQGGPWGAMSWGFEPAWARSPRVQGAFRLAGGLGEAYVGALAVGAGFGATETGVAPLAGVAIGGAAIVHGADQVQTGFRELVTGQSQQTFTQQGATALTGSETAGALIDTGLSFALTAASGGFAAARAGAGELGEMGWGEIGARNYVPASPDLLVFEEAATGTYGPGAARVGDPAFLETGGFASRRNFVRELQRLGIDKAGRRQVYEAARAGDPVVVTGENMGRVQRMAARLRDLGLNVRTYTPRNWYGGVNRLNMGANRSWIRFWAKEKSALFVDIGRETGRALPPSPYYGMEVRSLVRWGYSRWVHASPGF